MKTEKRKSSDADVGPTLLWKLLGGVAVAYAIYTFLVFWFVPDKEHGTFGDAYGGLNALFSAFAFAGLIYTALLQRRELSLQREELEQTRTELKGQREALEKQNTVFLAQGFESTFFHLLQLHHQIVGAIEMPARQVQLEKNGRYAFETFLADLRGRYAKDVRKDPRSPEGLNELDDLYLQSYSKFERSFGHYFRNLYHIFKFIDQHPEVDRYHYASLARAQLSTDELACLFYNCLSQLGTEKFKPLAERYALFKNLPWKHLLHEHHVAHYDNGALYGRAGA